MQINDIHSNDELADKIGKELAEIFNLKQNKDGFYQTTWGSKTSVGITRIAARIIQEGLSG